MRADPHCTLPPGATETWGVLRALIAAGADLNAPDDAGWTPLHDASRASREHQDRCSAGHWSVASTDVLIEAGADPHATTKDLKHTPLHFAAWSNANVAAVESLVAAGADPNARSTDGWTPLHFSARCNEAQVTAALLTAGADPDVQDRFGQTPLHEVRRVWQHVDLLVSAGARLDARDDRGRTPLHNIVNQMSWEDDVLVIKTLIARGADIEARDADWDAPLHAVSASGGRFSAAAVDALLKAGSDVDAQTRDGDTPLHLAAASTGSPHRKVIALLDAGANPLETNARGQTPADIAAGNQHIKGSEAYRRLVRAMVGRSISR